MKKLAMKKSMLKPKKAGSKMKKMKKMKMMKAKKKMTVAKALS